MAAGEDQAKEVIADLVVHRSLMLGCVHRHLDADVARQLLLLSLQPGAAADQVDRPVLRGGHEPGARVVRDARLRPALQRRHQRVLGEILGEAEVAHHPRQAGDQSGGLDPPDCLDGAVGFAHPAVCSGSGWEASAAWRTSSGKSDIS